MSQHHYVRGSKRQKGYFRRRPYTVDSPTHAQRQARAILARTAFEKGWGKVGKATIVKEGEVKKVPASAVPVMEEMKDKIIAPPKPPVPVPVSPYEQLRKAFIRLAEAM